MILVFAPKSTSRLRYAMQLVLGELLGLHPEITTNPEDFYSFAGPKFIYGKMLEGDHLYVASGGLLFESGIGNPSLQVAEHEGIKVLFPVYDRQSALPYDPFSAAFFMVSRYEEYMPYRKDQYGRFTAMESLAHKMGFLQKPVVNLWALQFGALLSKHFKGIRLRKSRFRFIPTYDIDQAWAYRSKGFVRTAGATAKALLSGNFNDIVMRTKVVSGMLKDPFDTFDYQLELQKRFKLQPVYFFLFARYGEYDKNIPTTNIFLRKLIKRLADYADAGIHPSYASNTNVALLAEEINGLSKVLNREIKISRQHYLKLHLPETYRRLAEFDITTDFTMGFAALPGFRAGICSPFRFYDIDSESVTPITVVPFAVMDGTLREYMSLGSGAAIDTIHGLIDEVKQVDGTFCSVWHNHSLSETGNWIGWRRVYEELIKKACE